MLGVVACAPLTGKAGQSVVSVPWFIYDRPVQPLIYGTAGGGEFSTVTSLGDRAGDPRYYGAAGAYFENTQRGYYITIPPNLISDGSVLSLACWSLASVTGPGGEYTVMGVEEGLRGTNNIYADFNYSAFDIGDPNARILGRCSNGVGSWNGFCSGADELPMEVWSHVVCSYDGINNQGGAVNGVQSATTDNPPSLNTNNYDKFHVGSPPGQTFWYMHGLVTDAKLINASTQDTGKEQLYYDDGRMWSGYREWGRVAYFLPAAAAAPAPTATGYKAGSLTSLGVGI
jgi:hypothetical protein